MVLVNKVYTNMKLTRRAVFGAGCVHLVLLNFIFQKHFANTIPVGTSRYRSCKHWKNFPNILSVPMKVQRPESGFTNHPWLSTFLYTCEDMESSILNFFCMLWTWYTFLHVTKDITFSWETTPPWNHRPELHGDVSVDMKSQARADGDVSVDMIHSSLKLSRSVCCPHTVHPPFLSSCLPVTWV